MSSITSSLDWLDEINPDTDIAVVVMMNELWAQVKTVIAPAE